MLLTTARLSLLLGLAAMAAPVTVLAQKASPREAACHAEATRRYIEDFRRVGPYRDDPDATVVVFVNDKSKYEAYYAECLDRWNSMKGR